VFNDMDKWTRIRRDVLAGGMSCRQAVKKYNFNFRTIQKVLRQEEPPEHRKKSERDGVSARHGHEGAEGVERGC